MAQDLSQRQNNNTSRKLQHFGQAFEIVVNLEPFISPPCQVLPSLLGSLPGLLAQPFRCHLRPAASFCGSLWGFEILHRQETANKNQVAENVREKLPWPGTWRYISF